MPTKYRAQFRLSQFDAASGLYQMMQFVIPWSFVVISRWYVISNIDIYLHDMLKLRRAELSKPNVDGFGGFYSNENIL